MKNLFSMLLALAMAVSLAACGAGASGIHQESQSGSSSSANEPPASAEPDSIPDPSKETSGSIQEPSEGAVHSTLVACFSATGNTEGVAQHLQALLDADLYEIVPTDPYSDDDLNYNVSDCRANQEQNDPDARPAIDGGVDNIEDYDVIFLGYPIWWGIAAWPVNDFVTANDFTGKTVIPFCTSASSGLGESGELLAEMAGTGDWLEGQRFPSRVSREDVQTWLDGLGL